MIIRAWRIVQERRASDAMTGDGARLYGGRWNPVGVPVVYAASSESLAMLELLVHAARAQLFQPFVSIPIDMENDLVDTLPDSALPPDWAAYPGPEALRKIGADWVRARAFPVLSVPSAVVHRERNFLLNPLHPEFHRLLAGKPERVPIDGRLLADQDAGLRAGGG